MPPFAVPLTYAETAIVAIAYAAAVIVVAWLVIYAPEHWRDLRAAARDLFPPPPPKGVDIVDIADARRRRELGRIVEPFSQDRHIHTEVRR